MATIHHYQHDLFEALVEALPSMTKSKKSLIDFFTGAGVEESILKPWRIKEKTQRDSFNKYELTRDILSKINSDGDRFLRVRREILKRVVEFEDFTLCYDNNKDKARGCIARIKDIVNVKDSFTRINQEREYEAAKHRQEKEREKSNKISKLKELDQIKNDFYSLFAIDDAHKRGKLLETVLNSLFKHFDILVREAFAIKGECKEGIIEQIDGVIELDGRYYLIEMKWWKDKIGVPELSQHISRIFLRGDVCGAFISTSGFTETAITTCKEALSQKLIFLIELEEIVKLLEQSEPDMKSFLKSKIEKASIEKIPLYKPL
jgi:hypothetical protein